MSTSYWGNDVFGFVVELTSEEERELKDLPTSSDEFGELSERVGCCSPDDPITPWASRILSRLRDLYGLASIRLHLFVSDNDGCHAGRCNVPPECFLLGIGKMEIVEMTLEDPGLLAQMLEKGAQWHGWVCYG